MLWSQYHWAAHNMPACFRDHVLIGPPGTDVYELRQQRFRGLYPFPPPFVIPALSRLELSLFLMRAYNKFVLFAQVAVTLASPTKRAPRAIAVGSVTELGAIRQNGYVRGQFSTLR